MTYEVVLDEYCPASENGRHYKLMTIMHVKMSGYRPQCTNCGAFLRVKGAKWVSESIVINELGTPPDLLR